MVFKKISALFFSAVMIFLFTACQDDADVISHTEVSTQSSTEVHSENTSDNMFETVVSDNADKTPSAISPSVVSTTALLNNNIDSPSAWSKAKIVEIYKAAAAKSNANVKSEQSIALSDVSINNGEYSGVIDFVKPIMTKLLSNNSTEKDGITGGYTNLVESDVYEAKAYAVGDKTAIEMVMREQTDGADADALSGTVGHAISVVGDISIVTKQLNDLGLPIEISKENTTIYYTNPVVKVLIDSNGKILNGTWQYTVHIKLDNYKVGNSTVKTTSVIMDNIITVNGGFNK